MNPSIDTQSGQLNELQEQEMFSILESKYNQRKNFSIIKTSGAKVDGFWIRDKEIVALFGSKCRNITYDQLFKFGHWLIEYEKIESGIQLSEKLKVPFIGLLYLIPSKSCFMWEITDNEGNKLVDYEISETDVQSNKSGELIKLKNINLPLNHGIKLF